MASTDTPAGTAPGSPAPAPSPTSSPAVEPGAPPSTGAASTARAADPARDAGPAQGVGLARGAGPARESGDIAGLEAGLDALESTVTDRQPWLRTAVSKTIPPVVAVVIVLALWQLAYHFELKPHYLLPSPADVAHSLRQKWLEGTLLGFVWTSLSRGALGFLASVALGTVLGLVVARIKPVRAAIGPILSGLQSLPSVAWVPAAIIWFGLSDATIYAVVLLGAVPSIANGLVAGVDQISPLYLRAGRTIGATGPAGVRHVLLPAALPGYLAGLKQGWAFSWRSLMAAELIVNAADLGTGLGQLLEQGRELQDMSWVLSAILLILVVGIGIELLIFAPIERRVLRSRGLLVKS